MTRTFNDKTIVHERLKSQAAVHFVANCLIQLRDFKIVKNSSEKVFWRKGLLQRRLV